MMDAISFVLGVKSSHLRSHNIKDLIYRGRLYGDENDDDDEYNSTVATRAYVMAVYEKDDGEILNLKRTIAENGSSEYRINDKAVTALNYSTVLKSQNILINARNFLVFQGDVEKIASQSSKDLTKLLETICGSNECIPQFEHLKEELERAHELSNSVFSRKRTLNSESKQYKEQLAEQQEFEEKLFERTEAVKKINLYKLYHNEKKHLALHDDLKREKDSIKTCKKKLADHEKSYKLSQSEYSKSALELKKHEKSVKSLATDIENNKRLLVPLNASRRSHLNKISSLKNKVVDITTDVERQRKAVLLVEKKLRDANRLYNEFQTKSVSSTSSISHEGQMEYEGLRSTYLASGGSELEEQVGLLTSERDVLNATIESLENQKSEAGNKIEELTFILNSDIRLKLNETTTEINDILALKQEKIDTRSRLIKSKDEHNFKELQLNSQLRDVLLKLDDLTSQQRESEKQRRLRENVSLLSKLFPKGAIKGLVSDLVRPSKQKYENALLTILGMNFDSIIIESAATAYKCIEILKERRLGTATFIPLDSIAIEPINLNYLRSLDEKVQPGVDILEYDDKNLEQAVQYVVGDSLVVENMEIARNLKWKSNSIINNKIVTLDGSVIHKSGLMTGGLQQQKQNAVLSWDKNELNKLSELKDDLTTQLSKLADSKPKGLEITTIADEITQLDDKLPILRNQKASLERVVQDRNSEISFQKELTSGFSNSLAEKNEERNKVVDQINEVQKDINKLQDEIYSDFCERYSFENGIDDYEKLHGSSLRERTKEKLSFARAVSVLTNKLSFEKNRCTDTEKRKVDLESQMESSEAEMLKIIKEKQEVENKVDELEAEYEVLLQEKESFSKSLQDKLKNSKVLESTYKEIENELADLNKLMTQTEEQLLSVDTDRVNHLKSCKIQNINIPLKDGLLESISIGDNSDSLVADIYDIEIDYSDLDQGLRENYNLKTEASLEANLQNIIDQLEKLTPNAKAVERLKEVETKIKEFDTDHTIARQKERKVAERFQQVKTQRYDRFMEAFNHISKKIDEIYKELTKSAASPLGGSAYLTLEDDEEPYNSGIKYHAMPPMKRFRDMELLSGGEKTMAALALLFAIHSYQPSPFFILDEVDAALDNANVTRIANYIKKSAGPNFQFIVISLKNSLFEKSDALVGIFREQRQNSSRTVTLDLREYPEEENEPQSVPVA
jgi:structural maintenance of chromosome 1